MAQAALNYATKCRVRSNPNRVQEVIGLDEVGEIWAISRSTFTFIDYEQIAAETWIIESFAYLYDANECLKEDGCRNYTQVVHCRVVTLHGLLCAQEKNILGLLKMFT